MIAPRRWLLIYASVIVLFYFCLNFSSQGGRFRSHPQYAFFFHSSSTSRWLSLQEHYPVESFVSLPLGRPRNLPKIQHDFPSPWDPKVEVSRIPRLERVRESFKHAWNGYKTYAWLKDEVAPLSGRLYNTFGGWAATLVDCLDTLWIMGFKDDFDAAVEAVATLNFTTAEHEELNVFETTIRYVGGLLAAYDLSGNDTLLHKAVELGNMMYVAFDTPNRMPITRWNWQEAANGNLQEAQEFVISAEVGSLSLEFTRLSQLTGDPKFFDAIQRITRMFQSQQDHTELPGMWPVIINAKEANFKRGNDYSLGAMADSLYEYLPKEYMLLGGLHSEYQEMYEKVIARAKKSLFFHPLNTGNHNILLSGSVRIGENEVKELDIQGQHLACFVGGMVATAAQLFQRPEDIAIARQLVDGCIWAYSNTVTGLMPETFHAIQCVNDCNWKNTRWHRAALDRAENFKGSAESLIAENRLSPGFADIPDRRYILRPEAIESIFMLYRVTGDETLRDKAWKMFEAIERHTRTDIAHTVVDDVTTLEAPKGDRMETFWLAETLKYFYLLYSDPDTISLDDYVFNTEAHPFKRPK